MSLNSGVNYIVLDTGDCPAYGGFCDSGKTHKKKAGHPRVHHNYAGMHRDSVTSECDN